MTVVEFISKAPSHIQPFVLFGPSHLMAISVLFLGIYTATVAARQSDVFKKHYRLFLILALSIQEVVFKVWSGFYQPGKLSDVFSLHLCSIAIIALIILLIDYRQWIFELVYFWGLVGASQAILTPDITQYGFPHFRFFQVFFSHGLIIAGVVYFLVVEGKRLEKGALKRVLLMTNLYALIVFHINLVFHTNYLFVGQKPDTASLIDYLGPWPYYIIWLEVLVIVLFSIAYLPFWVSMSQKRGVIDESV